MPLRSVCTGERKTGAIRPRSGQHSPKDHRYGADLVIGHHPHVLQGIERYRRGHIAYSLGNFLFSDLDWRWVNSEGRGGACIREAQSRQERIRCFTAEISETGVHRVSLTGCRTGKTCAAAVGNPGRFETRMRVLSAPSP